MKLSISNIAWSSEHDQEMYLFLMENGFSGLEIAPTRIIPENPYEKTDSAKLFSKELKEKYNLVISSMQSILYGRTERLFGSEHERKILMNYTKTAIDFASQIDCKNLVFGSPKNRIIESIEQYPMGLEFFNELGNYAFQKNTCLSIEANPTIYNTNYINNTNEAFKLVREANSEGFKVNIDLGTIIYNNEEIDVILNNIDSVNHIHISEPNLVLIEKRDLHDRLAVLLMNSSFDHFVSIEMKNMDNIKNVKETIRYIKGVFNAD